MVLRNDFLQVLESKVRFVFGEFVDSFGKDSVDEESFPTSDWVRSDDWVNGRVIWTDVQRVTTDAIVSLDALTV